MALLNGLPVPTKERPASVSSRQHNLKTAGRVSNPSSRRDRQFGKADELTFLSAQTPTVYLNRFLGSRSVQFNRWYPGQLIQLLTDNNSILRRFTR